jgi:type I restriction enzyme R subunit
MSQIGQVERKTQERIIRLFEDRLHYDFLGDWHHRENNRAIEEIYLRVFLVQSGYSEGIINKAIFALNQIASNQTKSLYDVNKEVYTLLRYGIKVQPDVGENNVTVHLIDWKNPEANYFAIAEEVTVIGVNNKRPDLVIYVNGIALAVIELKRSTVSLSEGIRQNIDSQKPEFIRPFFSTIQFVMAGNDSQGLRYGTIETKEEYYLKWKERGEVEPSLDNHISALFAKARFLELIHDFVVYDSGIKKLCRHNQYNAVKAAQESIQKSEGGIIWHTQGSGKSLIMVWLAKWIRENIPDSRVLIITDRDELDKQIEMVFRGVDEKIVRTRSGVDLISRLNSSEDWLICSLIHKFRNKDEDSWLTYIKELRSSVQSGFEAKGNIHVFVDECHRTQSGELHKAMKAILPDALFIGFTGTPLMRKDKKTTLEVFGKYIDTYKFDEAVADNVIVDLSYEARDIDQHITSEDKIDEFFQKKTKGLSQLAQADLKRRWATLNKVLSSKDRLQKIVADIVSDMEIKDRLSSGRGNAMLVAGSIYDACRFYELFNAAGFDKCAIVTSYEPDINNIKLQDSGSGYVNEEIVKDRVYRKMLAGRSVEAFEDEVKKRFVEEPEKMKLLIVVDKLLTGFDAPSATYLYIDKFMRDHGLFQAICRVNRIDGEDKNFGFIIDYKDLFFNLEKAVTDYTSEAFDGYDEKDVIGLLSDRLTKAKERLEQMLESIRALCEPVQPPKEEIDYVRYFCGNTDNEQDLVDNEPQRLLLYKTTASLLRAYVEIANEMEEAGFTKEEADHIADEVARYENLRKVIKLASGDYIDLKMYEPAMRHLIDNYIEAEDPKKISAFDDLGLVDLFIQKGPVEAIEELPESIKEDKELIAGTMENNVRKVIVDETPQNPIYYEQMSKLLAEIIKLRKDLAICYEEYLKRITDLMKRVRRPETTDRYTPKLNTKAKRALYDNLDSNEELALTLHDAIIRTKKDEWRGNLTKERQIKEAIYNVIKNTIADNLSEVERIFEIVKNQAEY